MGRRTNAAIEAAREDPDERTKFDTLVADLAEVYKIPERAQPALVRELHNALEAGQEGAVCLCPGCRAAFPAAVKAAEGTLARPGVVRWLLVKAEEEKDAARQLERGGAQAEAIALHTVRAETMLDIAAWLNGRMDHGVEPVFSRDWLADLLSSGVPSKRLPG